MGYSVRRFFRESVRWRIVFLTTVIFITFFITVFPIDIQKTLYDISFTLVFLLGYINSERKHPAILPVSVSAVALLWVSAYLRMPVLFAFSYSLNIVFFGLIVATLVKHLAGSKTVTPRIILESIITYLLIGLIYSMIISLIDHYDPTAFSFPDHNKNAAIAHLNDFIYFTFVTLSTTGYGDIIPMQPYSRSLTILIAITGQMYIAIIIAMIVGKYAAARQNEQSDE